MELPCKVCGKGIAYSGPRDQRRIRLWNEMAAMPPRFTCRVCTDEAQARIEDDHRRQRDQAIETAVRAHAAAVEAIRAYLPGTLDGVGVPWHWRDAHIDRCPDLPPKLVELARRWAENPRGTVFLSGTPGAGKSYLAVAMMGAVLTDGAMDPDRCRYLGEREFLDELKATFDANAKPASTRTLPPSHPRRAALLLYDDLGAARQTDWTRGEIATLLEARHAEDLPTIITSNFTIDEVARAIDGRLASRIAESGQVWELPRTDLRVKGTLRP